MNITTVTYFELTESLQVRWHGGKTFNIYKRIYSEWAEWDVFSNMNVNDLEDATEAVESWYIDLVACGEHEEYL